MCDFAWTLCVACSLPCTTHFQSTRKWSTSRRLVQSCVAIPLPVAVLAIFFSSMHRSCAGSASVGRVCLRVAISSIHDAEEWEGELDSGRGEALPLHSPLPFADTGAALRDRSKTGHLHVIGWFKSLPDGGGRRVAELSWLSWHYRQS